MQNVISFDSSVPVGRDKIEAGMSLIKERDKLTPLGGMSLYVIKKEGKIRRGEGLESKLKPRQRYLANVKTQSPVSGICGFPPSGPSIAIMCWHCKRPGHNARFCRAPIPPSNFGQALRPGGKFPNPNKRCLEQMFI